MFIYLATTPALREQCIGKIGSSGDLYGRRHTYRTGCPPGQTPSQDIDYESVWETSAGSTGELCDQEKEVHYAFRSCRLQRARFGDSEWFDFRGESPLDAVARFIGACPWFRRQLPPAEIERLAARGHAARHLQRPYRGNLALIRTPAGRSAALDVVQGPVIAAIARHLTDADAGAADAGAGGAGAGYVVAPCGSGKTVMTVRGIRGVRACVICCPSTQIQRQWRDTLVRERAFPEAQIHFIGGAGTTDPAAIRAIFAAPAFCVVSTYMSSHLLVDAVAAAQLLVLDEAHHMAGVVAVAAVAGAAVAGAGRTRRLLQRAADLGVRRLALTYTPRFVAGADTISMDDEAIFGKRIAELKIRDLIRAGVLPDYRIWMLSDASKTGRGPAGKAECLLEAWGATEVVGGAPVHILHHLIVFAPTTDAATQMEQIFKARSGALVLRVGEGDPLEQPLREFAAAGRAILVNCFVLNEGVDIPVANAVAITYPKQSRGQITQMVLRAGRWREDKSVFHVIIPTLGDEDLSGFEDVLTALGSCDEQLRDEVVLGAQPAAAPAAGAAPGCAAAGAPPECVMVDEFGSDPAEVRRCFAGARKNLFPAADRRHIQALCVEKGIDTSVQYAQARADNPELPEDPRPKGVPWYDFLHPARGGRAAPADFAAAVLGPNGLRVGHAYDAWRAAQPAAAVAGLPTVQHISDGFFGEGFTNFNDLCGFGAAERRGRR